jgi:3-oxoacyl-[acyl-carrier protein] reductase
MMFINKNIIVTGAAGGIGRETVRSFAEAGANVIACARCDKDGFSTFLDATAKQFGVELIPVYFDFSDPCSIKNGFKEIMQSKKTIDVLVNNAGIIHNALFQMTSIDKMRQVFEINFFGPMLFTQSVIKLMMRNSNAGKCIVNIASTAGIDCDMGKLAYGSSKSATITATKVLARELADAGIRVNAVAPSMTKTPMLTNDLSETVQQIEIQKKCIKRLGEVQDVVNTIMYLASEQSSYITGQVLRVDGGVF